MNSRDEYLEQQLALYVMSSLAIINLYPTNSNGIIVLLKSH